MLEIFAIVAPLFQQLVIDNAVVAADRDLLLVLALGFGAAAAGANSREYRTCLGNFVFGDYLECAVSAQLFLAFIAFADGVF